MKKIYQPLVEIIGKGKPVVGIVGAMHGNESGPAIIEKLKKTIKLKKGTIKFIIANQQARKINKRFIDEDLNRAFPGEKDGNIEQRLAHELIEIGKDIDYLIDLHSCSMESAPFAIIRNKGKDMELAKQSGLSFIVAYPLGTQGGGSFIDYVQCGIGLELGKHTKRKTIQDGFDATMNILSFLGMVDAKSSLKESQKVLQVTGHLEKEKGLLMSRSLKNFRLVRKGQIIGRKDEKEARAKNNFYPVLYKEKSYTNILGWMAEEIDV